MDSGLSWFHDLSDVFIRNFIPLGLSVKYQNTKYSPLLCLNYQLANWLKMPFNSIKNGFMPADLTFGRLKLYLGSWMVFIYQF